MEGVIPPPRPIGIGAGGNRSANEERLVMALLACNVVYTSNPSLKNDKFP